MMEMDFLTSTTTHHHSNHAVQPPPPEEEEKDVNSGNNNNNNKKIERTTTTSKVDPVVVVNGSHDPHHNHSSNISSLSLSASFQNPTPLRAFVNCQSRTNNNNNIDTNEIISEEEREEQRRSQRLREIMGLDEHGQPLTTHNNSNNNHHRNNEPNDDDPQQQEEQEQFDSPFNDYPVREWKLSLQPLLMEPITFNPIVTMIGLLCSWSIIIWTSVDPSRSLQVIVHWRTQVSLTCTWIFQGTKAILFFFLLYITYRYGHLHMSRCSSQQPQQKPDYGNVSYFCMIFASGIGVGIIVYCIAEPLFHQHDNFYVKAGYRSQDEIDMFAINMTVTNWGITAWIHYVIVAICMSLASHRFGLPMTFRSCFYPILGHYTWGWIGDWIDGLAVVVAVTGICTNLGLATIQIVDGFIYLGIVDGHSTRAHINSIHNATVWIITIITTTSMMSGINGGIRFLSGIAMALATFLLFLVVVMDDTKYVLNLNVQEIGYFVQTSVFQLNFWTDAYGQLREGSGRAVDGKAAEQWWMDTWMVFYQAWVITWAAFVGVFVARISRGRTLWEVVLYCFVAPLGYCLVWFTAWGGIGLRHARQSLELEALGATYFNNSELYLTNGSNICYDVPQEDVIVDNQVVFTNYLPGVTPVCRFDSTKASRAAFHVLYAFRYPDSFGGIGSDGLGPGLLVLFILACTLFFITSADSSALIIDSFASNGRKNRHWVRRMMWSVTVGALGTALLSSGGVDALNAAQSVSVVCGLPVAILMCYLTQSITLLCRAAETIPAGMEYQFPDQPEFKMPVYGGVLNVIEYITSFGNVHKARIDRGMDMPSRFQIVEFVKGLFVPFVSLHQVLCIVYPRNRNTNLVVATTYGLGYFSWIILFSMSSSLRGLRGLAMTAFVGTGILLGMVRSGFRSVYKLRSNFLADFVSGILLWPQVLTQMREQCQTPSSQETHTT